MASQTTPKSRDAPPPRGPPLPQIQLRSFNSPQEKSTGHKSIPCTPEWLEPLSRELEAAIAERNLLTGRTRKKVLDDLSSAAEANEEAQMEKLRAKAVEELLNSERSYLGHLEIIEKFFMAPIKERNFLPQSDFVSIFGDIPAIIQVNRELLASLEASQDKIGQVFLELAPYLKFYSTYAQDFEASAKLVEQWAARLKTFRTFLSDQESRPEVQLKLNALMITPVQRIPRYKMLLDDVIKNTPDTHPDKVHLKQAMEQIDGVAWHINEQLREHENSLKMLDIQKSLIGNFPNIIIPGRKLVKQGNLMKVPRSGSGTSQPRYFILFSDMLMYCKIRIVGTGPLILPKNNSLECCCMMPLKHVKVETLVGRGVFKVTCKNEGLILYASDSSLSSDWVDAISSSVEQHRKDASSLRKESSRREPMKRPEILKMRRESLSQIMMNKNKGRRILKDRNGLDLTPTKVLSPLLSPLKKKRPGNENALVPMEMSPSKAKKTDGQKISSTPKSSGAPSAQKSLFNAPKSVRAESSSSSSSVVLRKEKINRPSWKSLSLHSRKEKIKIEEKPLTLFRSPSIYDPDTSAGEPDNVMTTYLSGRICPLTPSQKQTDISHLVNNKPQSSSNSEKDELEAKLQSELKERLKSPKEGLNYSEFEECLQTPVKVEDFLDKNLNNAHGEQGPCTIM